MDELCHSVGVYTFDGTIVQKIAEPWRDVGIWGNEAILGGQNDTMQIWEISAGNVVADLRGHRNDVTTVRATDD